MSRKSIPVTRRDAAEPPGGVTRARLLGIGLMFVSAVAVGAVAYAVGSAHGASEAARAIVAQQGAVPQVPAEDEVPEVVEPAPVEGTAPAEPVQAPEPVEPEPVEPESVEVAPVEPEPVEPEPVGVAPVVAVGSEVPAVVEVPVQPEVDVSAIVAETVAVTLAELNVAVPVDAAGDAARAVASDAAALVEAAEEAAVEPVVEPVVEALSGESGEVVLRALVEVALESPGEWRSVLASGEWRAPVVPEVSDFEHFSVGDGEVAPAVEYEPMVSGRPGIGRLVEPAAPVRSGLHSGEFEVVPAGSISSLGW